MAQHPHLALAGPELARRQLQQRALARPVRAQQARDARRQLAATGCSGRSPARTTSIPSGTRPPAGSMRGRSSRGSHSMDRGVRIRIDRSNDSNRVLIRDSALRDSGTPAVRHRSRSSPRTRVARTSTEAAARPASTPADHCQGYVGGAHDDRDRRPDGGATSSGPDPAIRPEPGDGGAARAADRRPGPNGPMPMGPRTSRRPTSPRLVTRSHAVLGVEQGVADPVAGCWCRRPAGTSRPARSASSTPAVMS